MNTKLKFAFEKETKGAVRYQEVGEDGAPVFAPQVGTLYVRKSAMPSCKIPKTLIVTIGITSAFQFLDHTRSFSANHC